MTRPATLSRWDDLTHEQLAEAVGVTLGFGRPVKRQATREYLIAVLSAIDEEAEAA